MYSTTDPAIFGLVWDVFVQHIVLQELNWQHGQNFLCLYRNVAGQQIETCLLVISWLKSFAVSYTLGKVVSVMRSGL